MMIGETPKWIKMKFSDTKFTLRILEVRLSSFPKDHSIEIFNSAMETRKRTCRGIQSHHASPSPERRSHFQGIGRSRWAK